MNWVRWPRWRGPPLALQIMALLVGGLVVAQLVTLMLTLLLPPAPAPQYGLDDIAAALVDDPEADLRGNGLQRIVQQGPPDVNGSGWLVSERSRSELAKLIGVDPRRVSLAFYTPLPFAGTAAARSLAMANDGYAPPFKAAAYQADGPEAHFILAQFAGGLPSLPRGNRLEGAAPPRDGLPPGLMARGPLATPMGQAGQTLQPGTAPGLPPSEARAHIPELRGQLLSRQDAAHPLVSVDPRFAGNGLFIPGDNGAAVPGLLRGGENAGGATTAIVAAEALAAAANAANAANPAGTQVPIGGVAASRPGFTSPGFAPEVGARALGQFFAGGAGRMLPDRALIAQAQTQSVAPQRIAPPLIVEPLQNAQAPSAPSQRVQETAPVPLSPGFSAPFAQAPIAPPLQTPTFEKTPQALPYEAPEGPPIQITPTRRSLFGLAQAPFVEGDFVASLKLQDGRWAVVQPAPAGMLNSWQRRVLLWFAIALTVVLPLGWLFARRLVTPLQSFARAAEQLGRAPAAAIVPLDGPAEIGRAAHAFNLMQGRLRAFVDDRTAMVGAISHDLRTPLTRMRFRIEDVGEDDVRDGLLEEVEEMEAMIAQVIEFIRDASTPGARERLDLRTLMDDVVEDARLVGGDVTVEQADRAPVEVDVLGMRRLLDNLLENAVKYGTRARVRLRTEAEDVVAEIIDEGPGLPEEELERVFEPFYRSDEAIASDKKGSGLGLAVCRSIARAHGGDVRLVRGTDGFRAEVRLPQAYGGAPAALV
ncbi:ATP-binding protein [Sphingomonas sp.]|uniref:ATP-binding protein n=1 Tax=Sphingomonas sp. TaxID=28214 RepID=UPI000DB03146|nr:ATP-binding protein [Sphingomonas sp.]PZU06904.1 MAG: two-component sensor histidine kinase [Sphingomonas sp.]